MEENREQELIAQLIQDGELEEDSYEELPIPVSFEGLVGEDEEGLIPYSLEKFKKGVHDYSYIAGAFSALRGSGMSEENVMRWLLGEIEEKCLNKQLASQEKITQIQAEASLKMEA